MLKVAVIDDGVENNIFRGCYTGNSIYINDDYHIVKKENRNNCITHGTICAAIISQNVHIPISLYSVKVKGYNENGDINKFIKGLKFCVENDINIINISIGSTDTADRKYIFKEVKNAYSKGVILISALHNQNIETFPGSLPMVIGVRHTEKARSGLYHYSNISDFVLGAYSRISLIREDCTSYQVDSANSFAASLITAKVINLLQVNGVMSLNDIKKILLDICINK